MPQPFLELNAEVTEKALRKAGQQLASGKLTLPQFERVAIEEIRSATVAALRFASGGPLSTRQVGLLNNLLAEQRHYFDRMVAGFKDGSIPLEHAPARASAYAGSTVSAGAMGAVSGQDAAARFRWSGPDGERSCPDCGQRIGRVFTRDELMAGGLPGQMQCHGNCRCRVEMVEEVA